MLDPESEWRVNEWLTSPIDSETKDTIRNLMRDDPKALHDGFATTLSFGTGGMRGIMGVGTNRINLYTIQMATQGLANYLLKQPQQRKEPHVFIGYDSRHNSKEFAMEAARVLAGNGIGVYLCFEIRPTPYISFGVRKKQCAAGIMITASHNPKEYNGYKVYWDNGAQVVAPHDVGIVQEVKKITHLNEVKIAPDNSPLIKILDPEFDFEYLEEIQKVQIDSKEDKKVGDQLKITYTPLHGTGNMLLPRALKSWGFTQVELVDRQAVPDGDFPTVFSPNPENRDALSMGVEQMQNTASDLLIATDPDADRIAIATMHEESPYYFNGNQIAAICLEYLCEMLSQQEKLKNNHAVISTIVTTDLLKVICDAHHLPYFSVLTGFKYIGEMIDRWQKGGNPYEFLFGAEESYGYLIGTHSLDKDAIVSGCLIAEIALLMKVEGRTLVDFLKQIYKKYGFFWERQKTIDFAPGLEGMKTMEEMMEHLRHSPPSQIGVFDVEIIEDYELSQRHHLRSDEKSPLNLPVSNVLLFRFSDQSKLVVRPSGTEPKLKIYAGCYLPQFTNLAESEKACNEKIDLLLEGLAPLLNE